MSHAAHQRVLLAAAGGDDQALESLVRAHHDRVYRFGLRVCRDGFDADDAVQEAFSRLARKPEVARSEGALFWLFTVVKHACQRMLRPWSRERKHLGERLRDDSELPASELDPLAALERFELVRAVHAGIAALDRPYREVLILRDLEGLSGPETCAALGVELGAMKTRLHRARSQLREQLSQQARSSARGAV
jgi:RNA polymerase sigma-70 factor (ECF subfamily)